MIELYERLLRAWNERDVAGFAGLFADDGVLIGFDGTPLTGADIVPGDGTFVAKVRGVVGGGVLYAIAGTVPEGGFDLDPALNALHSVVVSDGRVVLFQSTPARYKGRPELAAAHSAELFRELLR